MKSIRTSKTLVFVIGGLLSVSTNQRVFFFFFLLQEVDPSNSAVKPKGPISLNAFTETVAGGRVDHDDEGDITSSDED